MFVDDMLTIGDKEEEVTRFKKQLAENYDLKDLGLAQKFLGMRIERDKHGIKLSQEHYVKEILERFGMQYSHPVNTPALSNVGGKLANAEIGRKRGEVELVSGGLSSERSSGCTTAPGGDDETGSWKCSPRPV